MDETKKIYKPDKSSDIIISIELTESHNYRPYKWYVHKNRFVVVDDHTIIQEKLNELGL